MSYSYLNDPQGSRASQGTSTSQNRVNYEAQIEQLQLDLLSNSGEPYTFLPNSTSPFAGNMPVTSSIGFQTQNLVGLPSSLSSKLNTQTCPPQSSASPVQSTYLADLPTAAAPVNFCSYQGCTCRYKKMSDLRKHIRKKHPSLKPYFCKFPNCGRFYCTGEERLFLEHVKAHTPHWDPLRIISSFETLSCTTPRAFDTRKGPPPLDAHIVHCENLRQMKLEQWVQSGGSWYYPIYDKVYSERSVDGFEANPPRRVSSSANGIAYTWELREVRYERLVNDWKSMNLKKDVIGLKIAEERWSVMMVDLEQCALTARGGNLWMTMLSNREESATSWAASAQLQITPVSKTIREVLGVSAASFELMLDEPQSRRSLEAQREGELIIRWRSRFVIEDEGDRRPVSACSDTSHADSDDYTQYRVVNGPRGRVWEAYPHFQLLS
ncbi:hypothetical protein SCHPADRAFT_931267 [Schizopora paradoxa]|uniref:C2H2-type domain-containing protein n=1 Tax=Schizopora paradoxa TaxID=27342 RepID=A0A0H2RBJ7_9AGAM|nr:hypothetical protein SCHPADRAFT_931267 [Schizopora paradoxa]